MDIKIIYEDKDVLVLDKPAGVVVFHEVKNDGERSLTMADYLIEKYPELKLAGEAPRYGIVHRLDKDTSGILLVAKTQEALIFLQKKFINRDVEKKYIALVCGNVKDDFGEIKTLIGRAKNNPRKQKVYVAGEIGSEGKREAVTHYKVIERYSGYTLVDVKIETGRRHQIRCHFAHIHHPIVGDKLYGYKDSPAPQNLTRQFLHAGYLKIQLPACAGRPSGEIKEFRSELPDDLKQILNNLKI
jgi:23S rRNA pseudouridine1911/1915/1917 synthase